jgi:hypothetical protein
MAVLQSCTHHLLFPMHSNTVCSEPPRLCLGPGQKVHRFWQRGHCSRKQENEKKKFETPFFLGFFYKNVFFL